jgi:hypothetical protein
MLGVPILVIFGLTADMKQLVPMFYYVVIYIFI